MSKKYPKFEFVDYAEHIMRNRRNNSLLELGIFYREQHILFGWEKDFGVRDYHFKVAVVYQQDRMEFVDGYNHYEILDFYHSCDLRDYVRKVKNIWFGDDEDEPKHIKFFDWDKLVKEVQNEQFEYLKDRIVRNYNNIIPEPVIHTADQWHHGDEFLVFTDETAYAWAGPFKQDGKQGACMNTKKYYDVIPFPILDVRKNWSYYQVPRSVKDKLEKHEKIDGEKVKNADYLIYHMPEDEKAELFDSFTVEEQHRIYKSYIRTWTDEESVQQLLPWRLYLCGTDDCSYTRWFATEEQMNEEINYLRKMQPLDMYRDIYDRDYIFTN